MALSDYEDALTSYMQDNDILVTYKWLSKEFEIHVNIAKDILEQYWKKYRSDKKLFATFLLVGQLKDRSIRIEIVTDSSLNEAKNKFISINCEHVYSLQNFLENLELLVFEDEADFCYTTIEWNTKYLKKDKEICNKKHNENINEKYKLIGSIITDNKTVKQQTQKETNFFSNTILNNVMIKDSQFEQNNELIEIKSETKIFPINKSNNNSKSFQRNNKVEKISIESKNSGFCKFFAKESTKNVQICKIQDLNGEEKKNLLYVSHSKIQVHKEKDKKSEIEKNKKKDERNKTNKTIHKEENKNLKSEKQIKVDNKLKSKTKTDPQSKKRSCSEENNILLKRKKIIVIDSSKEKSDNDDKIEKKQIKNEKQIPNIIKKSSTIETSKNSKHIIKKTVDKTFKDEDGYLVTKRIPAYEVASDNEFLEIKKNEPSKVKQMELKTNKQTTLMKFFKKP